MSCPNNLRWWFIRPQCVSILRQPHCLFNTRLQNPVNYRRHGVQLTHAPEQRFHLGHSSMSMQTSCIVIIATWTSIQWLCVWYSVALARWLVQMPAAAHSIPRTSEWLLNCVLLKDLVLSCPHSVSLRIQRDFLNAGIVGAFICVHHCPFLYTYGIYPHDRQNACLGTTTDDELGPEDDNLAPPFVDEVHLAVHSHFSLVEERAPHLMHQVRQVWDTSQDHRQTLTELPRSAIRTSQNWPMYRLVIYCSIVQECSRNLRCLPTLPKKMLGTIYAHSMLLKHSDKCISPSASSALVVLPQSTQAQCGVHSPSISE